MNGVSSDGFNTTEQPAAIAADAFLVIIAAGKFHCGQQKEKKSNYFETFKVFGDTVSGR